MSESRYWTVIAYEVRMLSATCEIVLKPQLLAAQPKVIANALEESAVLHTRILCEVFLSRGKEPDDIVLTTFFPDLKVNPRYEKLRKLTRELQQCYGKALAEGSPCWIFNKMMAHPTTRRGHTYDYTQVLRKLLPPVWLVIREVEHLRGVDFGWSW